MGRKIEEIAIIGAGNIGSAMAEGIHRAGIAGKITITRRTNHFTREEKRKFACNRNNKAAVANARVVILAVKPWQAKSVLAGLKGTLRGKILVSVVSKFTIEEIEGAVGKVQVVRAMPNTAIRVGQSMTCLAHNPRSEKSHKLVEKLFRSLGLVLTIPEDKFAEATVICGSGIAAFFQHIRDFMQGGIQHSFHADQALLIARQLAQGAAELLLSSGKHPEVEIDAVTTPGGCTIVLVTRMKEGSRHVHEGLAEAVGRMRG